MSCELRFDPRWCCSFHSFAVLLCLLQWIAYPLVKLETWHRVLVVCLLLEKTLRCDAPIAASAESGRGGHRFYVLVWLEK